MRGCPGTRNESPGAPRWRNEERRRGQPKKDPIHRDHVVQDLLVAARQHDDRSHRSLQHDGHHRNPGFRMHPADAPEEEPVARHGKVHPRRGQHTLAQESQGRHGDPKGDPGPSFRSQRPAHDFRGRRGRGRETVRAESAKADPVHAEIKKNHSQDAQKKSQREIPSRIANLAGKEARGLPAAIGKEYRDQRRAQGCDRGPQRPAEERRGSGRRPAQKEDAAGEQGHDGQDLGHHESALEIAPGAHAEAVHQRQSGQHRRGQGRIGERRSAQLAKVQSEGDPHRRHASALDDQQERPAIEKRQKRMEGLANVGVLTSDPWLRRGQLRPDEPAGQRDQPSQCPGAENESGSG